MDSLPFVLLILLLPFLFASSSSQQLTIDYYKQSCPRFDQIMQDSTTNKQISSPTTAAAALRILFHDAIVNGVDASVLISSTPFNKAERDADINLSLPGDGFDVVVRAKSALELACPGKVSCADILAVAARNLVTMVGGPYYDVKLGRKDALVSKASDVDGKIPLPTMSMNQIIKMYKSKGFSVQEMVALSGAHTIGFSHCNQFSSEIYNFTRNQKCDPSYNPRFGDALQKACSNYGKDPTLSVFNDIMTPNKFDNMYYQNLPKGLGLLKTDRALYSDPRTKPYVDMYIKDENAFFKAFAAAMEKLSDYGVKTGNDGQIRRRCDAFN